MFVLSQVRSFLEDCSIWCKLHCSSFQFSLKAQRISHWLYIIMRVHRYNTCLKEIRQTKKATIWIKTSIHLQMSPGIHESSCLPSFSSTESLNVHIYKVNYIYVNAETTSTRHWNCIQRLKQSTYFACLEVYSLYSFEVLQFSVKVFMCSSIYDLLDSLYIVYRFVRTVTKNVCIFKYAFLLFRFHFLRQFIRNVNLLSWLSSCYK